MAKYAIEFYQTRYYTHVEVIEAEDRDEAQRFAQDLIDSVAGDEYVSDHVGYDGHDTEISDVWESDDNDVTLGRNEIWKLIERG